MALLWFVTGIRLWCEAPCPTTNVRLDRAPNSNGCLVVLHTLRFEAPRYDIA